MNEKPPRIDATLLTEKTGEEDTSDHAVLTAIVMACLTSPGIDSEEILKLVEDMGRGDFIIEELRDELDDEAGDDGDPDSGEPS